VNTYTFLTLLAVATALNTGFYFAFDLTGLQTLAVGGTIGWFVGATAP
jgi:hypothetical protein